MITYATLKNNPRRFLSMTSLTVPEFDALVPVFAEECAVMCSLTHTKPVNPDNGKPALATSPVYQLQKINCSSFWYESLA